MKRPTVSILINNYNYGRFVGTAIESAIEQTYSHIEIVVVDDGSTDHSRAVIQKYKNVVTPIFKENGGQASAFNAGFLASTGEIICFLDSDDYFLSHKVQQIVNVFEARSHIGWCFHPLRICDSNGDLMQIKTALESCDWDYRKYMKTQGRLPNVPTATSGLCFRRSLLEKILPMAERSSVSLSDNYIKFAASALSQGFFIQDELAIQRIHGYNLYSLNSNHLPLKAEIAVTTAYWLHHNFPFLHKFSDNLLSQGLAIYWKLKRINPVIQGVVEQYHSSIPVERSILIYLRTLYRYVKYGFS